MSALTTKATPEQTLEQIPEHLIREVLDGTPYYYLGFRDVLNKTKTSEEIMADSGLQSLLKNIIGSLIASFFGTENHWILYGETGLHISHRNNLSLDVAVFEKAILPPAKITAKYIDVPPKLVIEIDINVEHQSKDVDVFGPYVLGKVNRLLEFGVEQVIWIMVASQKVIVAEKGSEDWRIQDLGKDVVLVNGTAVNFTKYIEEQGIKLEDFDKPNEA